MQNLIGTTLGRYKIRERIALGGMAAVYLAHQPGTEREVAIKVLPPQFADDPALVARFQREARLLCELQHPHILPVFDVGQEGELLYYVAPLLRHGDLGDYLARWGEALPLSDVRRIMGQLCDALDYAHAAGIVHRDLKPANVLLDARGNCLLSDFGIAKHDGGAGLTAAGNLIGTPEYMSPEQGEGGAVDRRSDIYALGVIAYQLATGRVPFKGGPAAVILKHQSEAPASPRSLNPQVPLALEAVILRALAKRPEDRYETAAAFGEAIRSVLPEHADNAAAPRHEAATAPPLPPPAAVQAATTAMPQAAVHAVPAPVRAPTRVAVMSAVALVAVIGISAGFLLRKPHPETTGDAPAATPVASVTPAAAPMPPHTAPAPGEPARAATAPPPTTVTLPAWREDFASTAAEGALPPSWEAIAQRPRSSVLQHGGILTITSSETGGGAWAAPPRHLARLPDRIALRLRLLAPATAKDAAIGISVVSGASVAAWVSCYLRADEAGGATPTCTDPRYAEFPAARASTPLGEWHELELIPDALRQRVQLVADGDAIGSLPLPDLADGWYVTLAAWSGDGVPTRGEIDWIEVE